MGNLNENYVTEVTSENINLNNVSIMTETEPLKPTERKKKNLAISEGTVSTKVPKTETFQVGIDNAFLQE